MLFNTLLTYGPGTLIISVGFILLISSLRARKRLAKKMEIKSRQKHRAKTVNKESVHVSMTLRDHIGEILSVDKVRYPLTNSGLEGIRLYIDEDVYLRKHMHTMDIRIID
jgi:hypothetical protein